MCDEFIHPGLVTDSRLSRRSFGLMTAALAGTAGAARAQSNVRASDVMVRTADGECDAVLFHPGADGKWPAVLVWPDIMGLRPVFRDMGRLDGEGALAVYRGEAPAHVVNRDVLQRPGFLKKLEEQRKARKGHQA